MNANFREDYMLTLSNNMAHAFGVIAAYAKKGFILYKLPPSSPPPSPPPQVSFMPPLQIMKCFIARYSCFYLLLNYSCTFFQKKNGWRETERVERRKCRN